MSTLSEAIARGLGTGRPLYGAKVGKQPCKTCLGVVLDPTDSLCVRCRWESDLAVRTRQEEALARALKA
jgi:hypothetical protein